MCNKTRYKLYFATILDSTTLFHPKQTTKGAQCSKYRKEIKAHSNILKKKKNYSSFFGTVNYLNYERLTELVHFKMCEL